MSLHLKVEHLVLRELSSVPVEGERWLLAISGGVDSMACAEILFRWRRYLKVELAVAHVHHGAGSARQTTFRDLAQAYVREWAVRHSLEFFTNPASEIELSSEEELREFRLSHLGAWAKKFDRIVFAHHADDLLETRILRLIRGSGPQGLKAMAVARGKILRPLLRLSREEIEAYAQSRDLKWCEDPSNSEIDSLRNWVRRDWLPQLEHRSPGSKKSLAGSLNALSGDKFTETIGTFVGLRRGELEKQSPSRREDIVARYLRSVGIKGYSRTHVQELLKRIGNKKNPKPFEMLGFSFEATPDFLWASRV